MNSVLWQPSASIECLVERARILEKIRAFFVKRKVLEVETPCLSHYTVTDPYLSAFNIECTEASPHIPQYLQTSPEFAMKRLLAHGSGDIFQISKAFRKDECGRQHNPEFTMLEWYRLGFTMSDLIDEVSLLFKTLNPDLSCEHYTYQQVFKKFCKIDPLSIDLSTLISKCKNYELDDYVESLLSNIKGEFSDNLIKDSLLQVIFNRYIEPHIGKDVPAVVSHFPLSQASLATINPESQTANRFEVYFKGFELANGFNELCDAKQQRERFELDNKKRQAMGLNSTKIDERFICALEHGLPPCSGVALGIDRLIMCLLDKNHISEVISFNAQNA